MICKKCGEFNQEKARYCTHCGSSLQEERTQKREEKTPLIRYQQGEEKKSDRVKTARDEKAAGQRTKWEKGRRAQGKGQGKSEGKAQLVVGYIIVLFIGIVGLFVFLPLRGPQDEMNRFVSEMFGEQKEKQETLLDENSMEVLEDRAIKAICREINTSWNPESEELKNFTYLGELLLAPDGTDEKKDCILYLVYQMDIRNQAKGRLQDYDEINTVYWYVRFERVSRREDGSLYVRAYLYDTPTYPVFFYSDIQEEAAAVGWYYYGYETLEELTYAVRTEEKNYHIVENNVDANVRPQPFDTKKMMKRAGLA